MAPSVEMSRSESVRLIIWTDPEFQSEASAPH